MVSLKGDNLEKILEKAPAYFGRYFRKVKVIDISEWVKKLEEAKERGKVVAEEVNSA